MSRSISLYFAESVSGADFVRVVEELGGQILDEDRLDVGISVANAHVWIYGARATLSTRPEHVDEGVCSRLGGIPIAGIAIALSHTVESGPLALSMAIHFLKRWTGVASLAAHLVADAEEAARFSAASSPTPLGPCLGLFFAEPPELKAVLPTGDAIMLDPNDRSSVASAEAELCRVDGADFDPDHETIVAMVAGRQDYIWILERAASAPVSGDAFEAFVMRAVEQRLGAKPTSALRLVFGYQASEETERSGLSLAAALLRHRRGIMEGTFACVFGVRELEYMLASGGGVFVS